MSSFEFLRSETLMKGRAFTIRRDYLKTPEDVARWLSDEFEYVMTIPDKPQPVEETLRIRTGDCDDFAMVASAALSRLGIVNEVVVIRFEGLRIGHAICAWKTAEGTYDFISTKNIYHTRQRSIIALVEAYYPGWKEIVQQ